MILHGHTKLELMRGSEVVHRIEKDNTITNYVTNVLNKGNYNYGINRGKIMPLSQFFNGCFLTDITNTSGGLPVNMLDGSAEIVAQAGNSTNSSNYLKRGSINNYETHSLSNGYQFCWDWNQNQGLGTINSVCLTKGALGGFEYGATASDIYDNDVAINEVISDSIIATVAPLNIIEYENEIGYKISYASSTITISVYKLNTKQYHLSGDPMGMIDNAPIATYNISQTIKNYGTNTTTVSDTASEIVIVSYVNNGDTMHLYRIDKTTFTCTADEDIVFTGAHFTPVSDVLMKDVHPIVGNYMYALSDNSTKVLKLDLVNKVVDSTISAPTTGLSGRDINGCCCVLPNGDIIKFNYEHGSTSYVTKNYYIHNDVAYVCNIYIGGFGYGQEVTAIHYTGYGTAIFSNGYDAIKLHTLAPAVSTINDLNSPVTKTITLAMRLTYRLTES